MKKAKHSKATTGVKASNITPNTVDGIDQLQGNFRKLETQVSSLPDGNEKTGILNTLAETYMFAGKLALQIGAQFKGLAGGVTA